MILNTAKDYYANDKERLRQQARDKYRNLSEEKKIKIENMEKTNIPIWQEKKQSIKEYQNQKNYCEAKKS